MTKGELQLHWDRLSMGWSESVCQELMTPWSGARMLNADYAYAVCVLAMAERFRQVDGVDRRSVESVDALLKSFGSAYRDFLTMGPHPFCLCARWGEVSDDTRCTALSSHDWLATEKVRGVRGMLFWRRGESPSVFGRGYASDGGLFDWSDLFSGLAYGGEAPDRDVVLDIEICLGGTILELDSLCQISQWCYTPEDAVLMILRMGVEDALRLCEQFKERFGRPLLDVVLLAPLRYGVVDLRKSLQRDIWSVYDIVCSMMSRTSLGVRPLIRVSGGAEVKKRLLQLVQSRGGEGVVLHNGSALYSQNGHRSSLSWVKVKGSFDAGGSLPERVDDTFDVVITGGYDYGSFKQLSLCVDLRASDGVLVPTFMGVVTVNRLQHPVGDYVGRVVEVSCDGFTDTFQMIRPRFVRLRDDKQSHETGYRVNYLQQFIR